MVKLQLAQHAWWKVIRVVATPSVLTHTVIRLHYTRAPNYSKVELEEHIHLAPTAQCGGQLWHADTHSWCPVIQHFCGPGLVSTTLPVLHPATQLAPLEEESRESGMGGQRHDPKVPGMEQQALKTNKQKKHPQKTHSWLHWPIRTPPRKAETTELWWSGASPATSGYHQRPKICSLGAKLITHHSKHKLKRF